MLVSASTDCFHQLPLTEAMSKLVDLEYSSVEIDISDAGHFTPQEIMASLDQAVEACRNTNRLDVVAYNIYTDVEHKDFIEQFRAIARLAKMTKVVQITVPSGKLGTPFNEEDERLRLLVAIAEESGVRVSIRSEIGCLSEDPDTVVVLCDNVEGLGVTLDPSHYICGPNGGKSFDKLIDYVHHVHLRDTSPENLQVRVGQGEVEYGRLINQLRKRRYNRALSVRIREDEEVDHFVEMRKMRLLLESLL